MAKRYEAGTSGRYEPDAVCCVEGCDKRPKSQEMCNTHYHRFFLSDSFQKRTLTSGQPCTIEGCERPIRYRGWCNTHILQWRRTGDPIAHQPGTPEERFWKKVDKDGPGGCWLWTGAIADTGYASFRTTRTVAGHRFAYELLVGPVPPGLYLDHVYDRGCRHRHCVNPDHLEAVTPAENTRRGRAVMKLGSS